MQIGNHDVCHNLNPLFFLFFFIFFNAVCFTTTRDDCFMTLLVHSSTHCRFCTPLHVQSVLKNMIGISNHNRMRFLVIPSTDQSHLLQSFATKIFIQNIHYSSIFQFFFSFSPCFLSTCIPWVSSSAQRRPSRITY